MTTTADPTESTPSPHRSATAHATHHKDPSPPSSTAAEGTRSEPAWHLGRDSSPTATLIAEFVAHYRGELEAVGYPPDTAAAAVRQYIAGRAAVNLADPTDHHHGPGALYHLAELGPAAATLTDREPRPGTNARWQLAAHLLDQTLLTTPGPPPDRRSVETRARRHLNPAAPPLGPPTIPGPQPIGGPAAPRP